jgi:ClpP class serine protease
VAHLADTPRRLPFRESPTAEALAIDRWSFGSVLGAGPRVPRIVRPGAFGFFFDCPEPIGFLGPDGKPRPDALLDGGIAVLRISGPLEHQDSWCWASYHAIQREVETALAWPDVRALVLKLDSPGGVCAGMLACHRHLRRLRAKHGKPLVAWVDELAASAAYGLASACDEIWMPPEGEVGSIGVILCVVDEGERLKREGVAVRYVVTGKRKADMHPGAPVTDDVLRVAQTKVDQLGGMFFGAVAQARGTTPPAIAGLEAAVFRGKQAVSAGLADGIADWPEFLGTLRGATGDRVVPQRAATAA